MSKNAKRRWKEISEKRQQKVYVQTEEMREASECLYEFVQNYIENHKISCPESIHQSDELNLDAPHFMQKCCEIVGYHT
jgi:hypothetical protein